MVSKNPVAWLFVLMLSCSDPCGGVAEPMNWPCPGRCIDAGLLWRNGFAVFFKGNQFWRYDIVRDKVDWGEDTGTGALGEDRPYPRPVSEFAGLPPSWFGGFDAALNGGDGKVYWFKGREYLRYDIAGKKVDAGPRPIADQWPGLPPAWTSGFTAAVNWGNGKIYFFKGFETLSYDLATDKAGESRPVGDILRGLPAAWHGAIDTAVNWGNGKAYIFKGHEYLLYDIVSNKADGDARPIASNWPGLMRLIDWAKWSPSKLPDDAIDVGRTADKGTIFLCAAVAGPAIYPGRTWATDHSCTYSDGQREVTTAVYAVATTKLSLAWTAPTSAPKDKLVPIGVSPDGRTFFLCRAHFFNGIQPGRIEDLSGACKISRDGRTQSLSDNFEVASAPTSVNSPYLPHLVRMLSPLPGSDAFKDVCAAEVSYTVRGAAVGGHYPRELPDVKTLVQTIARNVCALLYRSPAEVPARANPSTDPWQYAAKLDILSEDNLRGASVSCDHSHCTLRIAPGLMFPKAETNLVYLVALLYHEFTHALQRPWCEGSCSPYMGAFSEGLADYIAAVKALERRPATVADSGGDWTKGYRSMAFFMDWIDRRYPDFAHRYNISNKPRDSRWILGAVRELTGKPIETLWQEYEGSMHASLGLPESLLRWSSDSMGIRVVSGTYGGNCVGRQAGRPGATTNKTWHLKEACEGKQVCEYRVVWEILGDPVQGCAKDYVAVWQCPAGGGGTAKAEPEAGNGSKILLSCKK